MTIPFEVVATAVRLSVLPMVVSAGTGPVEPGTASGWVETKGQRAAMRYAFASMAEDLVSGGGKEKIELLLSDKPVPDELRRATDAWSFWAAEQARKGLLSGVIVYLNPETKTWSAGQLLSRRGMEFYSQSVTSPELNDLVFTAARETRAGEIAGRVSMKKALRSVDENEGPWRVDVEFRTPVIPRPAVTGSLTGAEARNSAPYKAVVAYLQACQKRDLTLIRRSLNTNSLKLLDKYEAEKGKKAILDMFGEEAAEPLKMKLDKVTVRGETAEVVFVSGAAASRMEQSIRVVLENGEWKIGQ